VGNSTTSIQDILDTLATMGDASPQSSPGGYGPKVSIQLANDTMADLLSERFNWKFNSANAPAFFTNSYQQDYPQIGLTNVDWLELFQWIDINNTSLPKPISWPGCTFTVRSLPQCSLNVGSGYCGRPTEVCWMYNSQLAYGLWPGAGSVYRPLIGTNPTAQNGAMAFIDKNGNILVLTTFGTTGAMAPFAAPNATEGTTVTDNTVVWTVASPNSQGFRLWPLPGATGPVYQINVKYQMIAPKLTALQSLINPVPDNYSQHFRRGFKAHALEYSPDPNIRETSAQAREAWLAGMVDAAKQGDREMDAYGLVPASYPMDSPYPRLRNPRDPGQPY
jgi:hypothetical protein